MKRILGLMALVAVLMVPNVSFAASDQLGIYVAPKFVYGLTQMSGSKVHESTNDIDNATTWSQSFGIGDKTDSSFGGSLAIGYDFDKKFSVPIRTEIEYAIFSTVEAKRTFRFLDGNNVDMDTDNWKQEFGIQTLFLNAYWDINTGTKFTPYVGAGLGMAIIDHKLNGSGWNPGRGNWNESFLSKTETTFAWNVGAGLGYDINDNWTIDAGYRFAGLGSVENASSQRDRDDGDLHIQNAKSDLYQHLFSLGVRYTF